MKLIYFQCYYCEERFTLNKETVEEVEKIAVIKCPKCGGTEDIVETARD